jgi:hypothetical protein
VRVYVTFPWLTAHVEAEVRRDLKCLWWMGGSVGRLAPVTIAWSGDLDEATGAREVARMLKEWGYRRVGVGPAYARVED